MRWVFFSLLIANMGFFAWLWFETDRQQRLAELNQIADNRAMPGDRLQLVSELSDEQRAALSIKPEEKATDLPVTKTAELATDTEVETDTETDQPSDAAGEKVASTVVTKTGKALCMLIGPLTEPELGAQLQERLRALGIIAEEKEIEIEGALDYWVIVSPAESQKAALQTLQALQAKNIESFLIPQGDMANAISLGVYGQEENAQKQKEELSLLGYPLEVRVKAQRFKERWMVLAGDGADPLAEEVWLGIQEDFPKVEQRPGYCVSESPATEETTEEKVAQ